jgi:ABC-2 type transport system ATP-binding protein
MTEHGNGNERTSTPAVETAGLTRHYGSVTAVDSLDLAVSPGRIFGLLGPNGAGKTTTIKMLTTMLSPSAGRAQVAGFDVVKNPVQVRRVIGYVSQMLSADGALTGFENLQLFARIYGIPQRERKARILDALDFMGLAEVSKVLVRNYSGGMIRRLEIAQSMLHRPRVLFLDEPTIGLDPVARHAVWQHLRDLRERFGTTILLTTHDMEEADHLCEQISIMHRGRVVATGSPQSLKSQVGPEADLDAVFVHFAGEEADTREEADNGGGYRESARVRRTSRRLG